ncbi:hypothetical protein [Rhizobium ruizarguesonis]|uniref:hypothetical protein n=1 Tax=Rhizobium ruizarguesonis TaxID=2081791 RepID=UPI0013BFB09E|nr:hypothetical protein [Rhizobium ruizarguesonis]NEJ02636.1 hypothetical protein [Rhizobium ruizarguesonis]NEJ39763.1 hypothetical protein [Rhizobium ruizarguesonis]
MVRKAPWSADLKKSVVCHAPLGEIERAIMKNLLWITLALAIGAAAVGAAFSIVEKSSGAVFVGTPGIQHQDNTLKDSDP